MSLEPGEGRRYGTHKSNKDRHPAVEAGVAKRNLKDIQAVARSKRDEKQARADKVAREKEVASQRMAAAAKKIASLQDQRARRDTEAAKRMLAVPAFVKGQKQSDHEDEDGEERTCTL
ncbi:hypothetical protein OH77DRAFT_1432445 [Trametes cingulata]|nr:hypothetical protein OH77DRAFT_1432445 [Trametes cingulata]